MEPQGPPDPRLSVTCTGSDGGPLGFAWVQPSAGATYVVVVDEGYAEAYPVAGTVPVRVTTDDVDAASSSASVELSSHASDGRLLSESIVQAHVSD
jgi:hypothetical protein